MKKDHFYFILVLLLTWPLRYLPSKAIHALGRCLGTSLYYTSVKFRKRTLSNLSLASSLALSPKEIPSLAKASLQNLFITCLEYAKLASMKEISSIVTCVNPSAVDALLEQGKTVIFFCGHQANWELLFLEGTSRMKGVAIGRPIKNQPLYNWVLSIREKFGGTIISPKNAIREGLRALKTEGFLGIVGDQGMPDSGYSSPFLGRQAWTSPIAAILSHRTGSPIVVATTKRKNGHYFIHYSDPLWPQMEAPKEEEIDRLMKASLRLLETSIQESPGEWLWSHNRWKQQTPDKLKKPFRHESLLVLLEEDSLLSELSTFREIYPHEFITFYVPSELYTKTPSHLGEIIPYSTKEDLFIEDFRFKLVFNFTSLKELGAHFKKQAAFTVVSLQDIQTPENKTLPFSKQLKTHLLKN